MTTETPPTSHVDTRFGARHPGAAGFTSTRVVASFHTDAGFDGYVGHDTGDDAPFHIVGLTTNKAFGGAPGSWTLRVKAARGVDVMRLWDDPEDVWVRIAVMREGYSTEVLLGLLNTVTESMQRGSKGERNQTYMLTGLDFHKVLTSTILYINVHENQGSIPIVPMYNAVAPHLLDATPDSVCRLLIVMWLGNNGVADKQWQLPRSLGGGFFFDLLQLAFDPCRGSILAPELYSPDQMMGRTLWSSLEEYSNGLLNELFTDTDEGVEFDPNKRPRPRITLRERPFPTRDNGHKVWDRLPTHTLELSDVSTRNMSKGAPESRYNFWLLDAQGLVGNGMGVMTQQQHISAREKGVPGSAPIYSLDSIRKHGFRMFMRSTRFFPWRTDVNWFTHSARWLHMLHDWYIVNPHELSGSISTTAAWPNIRVGHRIREKRPTGPDVLYYVEGVSHQWTYPGTGITTLQLTRGEYEDKPMLDYVYARINTETNARNALLALSEASNALVSGEVPTADARIGQPPLPEDDVAAWAQNTIEDTSAVDIQRRGELQTSIGSDTSQSPNASATSLQYDSARVTAGELPDGQIGTGAEIAVGNAEASARSSGENLTQRELESGTRLPVSSEAAPGESAESPTDAQDIITITGKRRA